jgi:hypothetical protein
MSVSLSTETIQTTISQINRDFAGRIGDTHYNESRLLHIHRRNRAFVWNLEMQANLLDSILNGYYIPPIICCSRIVNGVERREVMEGGNRMTTIRRILNNEVKELTHNERQQVEAFGIAIVVMRNLTTKHQRKMFRRLNKGVKVSDGQLYAMSVDDSPLVKEAYELLSEDTYPLREIITRHFFDTRNADNDGKSNLANAVALVSGAINGVHFITKSYNIQDCKVDSTESINRNVVVQNLGCVFETFTLADQYCPLTDRRKARGQWSVGYLLGVILYDILTNPGETRKIQEKWARYISAIRESKDGAEDAVKIPGAQNLTATRYLKISKKVEIYLKEKRLATDSELLQYTHQGDDNEDDDSSVEQE